LNILRKKYPIPFLRIHLHKRIPAGAGLGGGSSDGACMLRSLNKTFNLLLSSNELQEYAASLGSDSPFFISCQPSFASGRGEILKPVTISLSGLYIVLVNPGISVSTREAYGNCVPAVPEKSLYETIRYPVSKWKEIIFNDFEKTIFISHPEIRNIKQDLYGSGALYSSMSGSGSTVYGIFYEKPSIPGDLREYVIYEGEV
jgi:4-diphosphocytidyl-2-C-methyl-D-erythritol kinase